MLFITNTASLLSSSSSSINHFIFQQMQLFIQVLIYPKTNKNMRGRWGHTQWGEDTHVGYVHCVHITSDLAVSAHSLAFLRQRMWLRMIYAWLNWMNVQKCDPICMDLCQLQRKVFLFSLRHKCEPPRRIKLPFSRGDTAIVMMYCMAITGKSRDNGRPAGLSLVTWVNHRVAKGVT